MVTLSPDQRAFINRFQGGFPLTERPYRSVAAQLGLDEATLISLIEDLLRAQVLSRFGPLFDAERLGGRFILAALSVPEADFDRIAAIVNGFPEVAHNYRRDHPLNMWFVVATATEADLQETLHRIRAATALDLYEFPKRRTFHLGFWLQVGEGDAIGLRRIEFQEPPADPLPLDALDRAIVQATQAGLPLVPDPYGRVGDRVGCDSQQVRQRLGRMLQAGAIRRIGAVPNHYRLGLRGNGMSVWDLDDAQALRLGARVGALAFVTHCYLRPRHPPLWPYTLFAMVHGRDRGEVAARVAQIAALLGTGCRRHAVLHSTSVLKKTGLRFGT